MTATQAGSEKLDSLFVILPSTLAAMATNPLAGGAQQGMTPEQQQQVKMITGLMESCPVKTAMAGGAGKCLFVLTLLLESTCNALYKLGFVMGGAFGLFMSSFEFSGPSMRPELLEQSTKVQMKAVLKDMGTRSYSMAKNFAVVGAIYSGTECCIESVS